MPSGVVPARIFNASPKSPEAIAQLRAAIGDEAATDAIQSYAVGEVLRVAGRPDGTLDPARLNAWRRSHANALSALPGLDARLADAGRASAAIADVATAREQARKAAQQGALGRLLQVDAPEDVSRIVGGVFSAQDATARMRAIRQAVGDDPEAVQGLRRAVVDHIAGRFVGNVEVGTSGTGGMRSDGFQTFVRQNAGALRAAGLETRDLRILDSIAADLQRSGRSIASVKNPGGSDTAQNFLANLRGNSPFAATARLLAAPGAAGIGVGAASGTTTGLAAGAAAGLFAAMRNAGLRTVDDLVTDALLNPDRARILLTKVPSGSEASVVNALARSYGNTAARALSQEDGRKPDGRRAEMRGPLDLRQQSGATAKDLAVADALGMTFQGDPFAGMELSPVARALAGRMMKAPQPEPSELARVLAGRAVA